MAFKTYRDRREMERGGWDFSQTGDAKPCRQCGEMIEWAVSPKGKNISLDANSCTVHFTHCGAQPARSTAAAALPTTAASEPAATNDLLTTMVALTQSVRELTAELKSRRPASPAPASARRRFDENGCPTDR